MQKQTVDALEKSHITKKDKRENQKVKIETNINLFYIDGMVEVVE